MDGTNQFTVKNFEAQKQIALRDHFYKDIQKVCRRLLDQDTAEEAANDAFFTILKKLRCFDVRKGSFLHWVRKVSWNHCLKVRAKLKRDQDQTLSLVLLC